MSTKPAKYCKYCGGEIDPTTKKCLSCGRQYFHAQTALPFIVLLIILIVCIVLLVGKVVGPGKTEQQQSQATNSPSISVDTNAKKNTPPPAGKSALYNQLSQSVVLINMYNDCDEIVGTASGFFILDSKTLVTCHHVIEGAYLIEAVCENGTSTFCEDVIAYDQQRDLAVLSCKETVNASPLALAESDMVSQGEDIFVIGSPLGLQNSISEGIVSALRSDYDTDILQITAAISPGSSGGAVFNANGEVIGIVASTLIDGQNLNLAIASNEVKELLNESKGQDTTSLHTLYADYSTYGISNRNLQFGDVTENNDYVFFLEEEGTAFSGDTITLFQITGARVVQFSKKTHEYKTLEKRATALNAYRGKLYFYSYDDDSVCRCDIGDRFGSSFEVLPIESDSLYSMLLAEGLIIVRYSHRLSFYNLQSFELIDEINNVNNISYVGTILYVLSQTDLYSIDLTSFETQVQSVPSDLYGMEPIGEAILFEMNYSTNQVKASGSALYKYDTEKRTIEKYVSGKITEATVCKDRSILINEIDGEDSLTSSVFRGAKKKYDVQLSDGAFDNSYVLEYNEDIERLGWKHDAILGIWSLNGEGYSI